MTKAEQILADPEFRADPWAKPDYYWCSRFGASTPTITRAKRAHRAAHGKSPAPPAPPSPPSAPTESLAAPAAPSGQPAESHQRTADSWSIHLPRTRIKTLEELLAHAEVDTQEWEVAQWTCNRWEVGAKDNTGNLQTETLYQVRAVLKRRAALVSAREEIRALVEEAKRTLPKLAPVRYPRRPGMRAIVSLPDIHFGKLCWGEETGADYDLKIARRVYRAAIDDLLAKLAGFPLERICYVVGNDLMHTDNLAGTTTKGTPQHVDGRYQKIFRVTWQAQLETVLLLRQVAPVDVVMVSGNHDSLGVFCLGELLSCRFEGQPGVTVDNSPRSRKYYAFGKCLLMFTHGDKQKLADLPLQMATEEPSLFAAADYREIHTGHRHKVWLDEFKGVRVRILPSLCAADAWHHGAGYTGSVRSAEVYVFDPQAGLVGTVVHNLPAAE